MKRFLVSLCLVLFFSCNTGEVGEPEDNIFLELEGFTLEINENPSQNFVLGKLSSATNSEEETTYQILSESSAGAFGIIQKTGEIIVLDVSLFDYEINKTLTAIIEGKVEGKKAIANIRITLLDVNEEIDNTGENVYTGPKITFTKASNADISLPENQDCITDNVWLVRASTEGLFNIAQETSYNKPVSPANTEWAKGTTADIDNLTFNVWRVALDASPPGEVGVDYVLHIIDKDIYIDFKLLSWSNPRSGNAGGAYSYERSTPTE